MAALESLVSFLIQDPDIIPKINKFIIHQDEQEDMEEWGLMEL